jgi:hypothetical protein
MPHILEFFERKRGFSKEKIEKEDYFKVSDRSG